MSTSSITFTKSRKDSDKPHLDRFGRLTIPIRCDEDEDISSVLTKERIEVELQKAREYIEDELSRPVRKVQNTSD